MLVVLAPITGGVDVDVVNMDSVIMCEIDLVNVALALGVPKSKTS